MVTEETTAREPTRNSIPQSQIRTMKYVTNQLLDKDGQLLTEHQTAKSRHPTNNTIQIV